MQRRSFKVGLVFAVCSVVYTLAGPAVGRLDESSVREAHVGAEPSVDGFASAPGAAANLSHGARIDGVLRRVGTTSAWHAVAAHKR